MQPDKKIMAHERIVLTGATGLMGTHLGPLLQSRTECLLLGHSHAAAVPHCIAVDLTDIRQTGAYLDQSRPSVIVHTVALTSVDVCEQDMRQAYQVNVHTTKNIAGWINQRSPRTLLAYISTDQVYDGPGPHGEEECLPANVYALTKQWGEDLARSVARHLVLRTNFYALDRQRRRGFAEWLIQSLEQQTPITLFNDVLFNPLYVSDLGEIVLWLIEHGICGTYNAGAAGEGLSKAEFAFRLAQVLGMHYYQPKVASVSQATLKAYRPRDMRMLVQKLSRVMDRPLPTIDDGLQRLADDYAHTTAVSGG